MSAKFGIYMTQKFAITKKLRTCVVLDGTGAFIMSAIFCSGLTPSLERKAQAVEICTVSVDCESFLL